MATFSETALTITKNKFQNHFLIKTFKWKSWAPLRVVPSTKPKYKYEAKTQTRNQNANTKYKHIQKPGHYPQVGEFIPMSWSPLSCASKREWRTVLEGVQVSKYLDKSLNLNLNDVCRYLKKFELEIKFKFKWSAQVSEKLLFYLDFKETPNRANCYDQNLL